MFKLPLNTYIVHIKKNFRVTLGFVEIAPTRTWGKWLLVKEKPSFQYPVWVKVSMKCLWNCITVALRTWPSCHSRAAAKCPAHRSHVGWPLQPEALAEGLGAGHALRRLRNSPHLQNDKPFRVKPSGSEKHKVCFIKFPFIYQESQSILVNKFRKLVKHFTPSVMSQ